MSATTLTDEFALLSDAFDYSIDQVRWFSRNAAKSAFAPYEMRRSLVDRINHSIEPSGSDTRVGRMSSRVLTAVAWPYANGRRIGHVSGFGVPSDVFSLYADERPLGADDLRDGRARNADPGSGRAREPQPARNRGQVQPGHR